MRNLTTSTLALASLLLANPSYALTDDECAQAFSGWAYAITANQICHFQPQTMTVIRSFGSSIRSQCATFLTEDKRHELTAPLYKQVNDDYQGGKNADFCASIEKTLTDDSKDAPAPAPAPAPAGASADAAVNTDASKN